MAVEILKQAVRYEMSGLISLCEDHLISGFNVDNVIDCYMVALEINLARLGKTCEEFYQKNKIDVEKTTAFKTMHTVAKNTLIEKRDDSASKFPKHSSIPRETNDMKNIDTMVMSPGHTEENKTFPDTTAASKYEPPHTEMPQGLVKMMSSDHQMSDHTYLNTSTKSIFLNELSEECKPVSMILRDQRVLSLGLTYNEE